MNKKKSMKKKKKSGGTRSAVGEREEAEKKIGIGIKACMDE